jgi:hypothetical protein
MRIVHVATGLITIPPNGWGAVERLTCCRHQIYE